jgi:hypothetical protein
MKKLPLVLLALAGNVMAAPFVVADIVPGVAQCGFYLDTGGVVLVPATGATCRLDITSVTAGAHVVSADARTVADPIWGSQISAKSVPLNFTRPAAPTVPSGLVLAP